MTKMAWYSRGNPCDPANSPILAPRPKSNTHFIKGVLESSRRPYEVAAAQGISLGRPHILAERDILVQTLQSAQTP